MRIRRTLPLVLAVVSVAAAVTLAVQLRKAAPPESARLLPGADAFFYLNLSSARKVNGNALPTVSHDPEYERFIEETGFQFERDLDAVAFAIHYPAKWKAGGTGGTALEPRFSEVFIGKFDGVKVADYLKQHAQSAENYNSVQIYTIRIDGRSLRVAILGADSVAASNHDDPMVIRGIVDRSRKLASPFGGPALLRRYYKRVQFASAAWFVAHIPSSDSGMASVFTQPADLIVSVSYNPLYLPLRPGSLHFRAEALAGNASDARNAAEKLSTYLALFHSAESAAGEQANDPDIKAMLDSLHVRQEDDRAVLTATVPPGFLKKLLAEGPIEAPASSLGVPVSGQAAQTQPEQRSAAKSKSAKK